MNLLTFLLFLFLGVWSVTFVHELAHLIAALCVRLPVTRFKVGIGPSARVRLGKTSIEFGVNPGAGIVNRIGWSEAIRQVGSAIRAGDVDERVALWAIRQVDSDLVRGYSPDGGDAALDLADSPPGNARGLVPMVVVYRSAAEQWPGHTERSATPVRRPRPSPTTVERLV